MNKERIKELVSLIIKEKAQGNSFQEMNLCMKLMLKGIPAKKIMDDHEYTEDPDLEEKIQKAAQELNVTLPNLTF